VSGGAQPQRCALRLPFLDPELWYVAHLFHDKAGRGTAELQHEVMRIKGAGELALVLMANGGAAVWLTPDSKRR